MTNAAHGGLQVQPDTRMVQLCFHQPRGFEPQTACVPQRPGFVLRQRGGRKGLGAFCFGGLTAPGLCVGGPVIGQACFASFTRRAPLQHPRGAVVLPRLQQTLHLISGCAHAGTCQSRQPGIVLRHMGCTQPRWQAGGAGTRTGPSLKHLHRPASLRQGVSHRRACQPGADDGTTRRLRCPQPGCCSVSRVG